MMEGGGGGGVVRKGVMGERKFDVYCVLCVVYCM